MTHLNKEDYTTTEYVILYTIWSLGFLIGLIATIKAYHKRESWAPWSVHFILGIFVAPIEIFIGGYELYTGNRK